MIAQTHIEFLNKVGSMVSADLLDRCLSPLRRAAAVPRGLIERPLRAHFAPADSPSLERFIFSGRPGGGESIRIGIFAGIHGDEPAGCLAIPALAQALEADAELTDGYEILLYPICNPSGCAAGSRFSASGKDLNREFWLNSTEAEVRLLEQEILEQNFNGLISLHSDDTSNGMYGYVRGAVLTRSLLEPALQAAEEFLPRNLNTMIDGFSAVNGIISHCYDGILTAPPRLRGTPFEVIIETPQHAPLTVQINAFVAATTTILREYRKFLAFAADL